MTPIILNLCVCVLLPETQSRPRSSTTTTIYLSIYFSREERVPAKLDSMSLAPDADHLKVGKSNNCLDAVDLSKRSRRQGSHTKAVKERCTVRTTVKNCQDRDNGWKVPQEEKEGWQTPRRCNATLIRLVIDGISVMSTQSEGLHHIWRLA